MKIHISKGNIKMGAIPSISLPPGTTCRKDAPCREKCYAKKAWRLYPQSRSAWQENLDFYQAKPERYFEEIMTWIAKTKPGFFRFHVSGDIPDVQYWCGLMSVCAEMSNTDFLVFTKRFELDFSVADLIPNLSVVLSMWPGLHNPTELTLPRAWCQDGTELRVPDNAMRCPGNCTNCGSCWSLKEIERDVVFNLH